MKSIGLEEVKESYVIARSNESQPPIVWLSPRGAKIEEPTERWSYNPSEAFIYDNLTAASNALLRMAEKYPNEFEDAKIFVTREFKREYTKKQYHTISELRQYNPRAKTVYVLEHQGKETYYISEEDRQEFITSNIGFTCYELKLTK